MLANFAALIMLSGMTLAAPMSLQERQVDISLPSIVATGGVTVPVASTNNIGVLKRQPVAPAAPTDPLSSITGVLQPVTSILGGILPGAATPPAAPLVRRQTLTSATGITDAAELALDGLVTGIESTGTILRRQGASVEDLAGLLPSDISAIIASPAGAAGAARR